MYYRSLERLRLKKMTTRKTELELDDYLYIDLPESEDVKEAQKRLNVRFPDAYKEILFIGAGMSPENLEPISSLGRKLGFRCFNHIFLDSDEPHKVNVHALSVWGYGEKLLEFADNGGGVRYCLDYRADQENPPVVVVYAWGDDGDEEAIEKIADNFEQFLEKYIV
jgi:hypothetical protein